MTKVRGVRATGHRLQVAGCGLRVTGRGNDGSRADLSSPKVEKPAAGSWQRAPLLFENRKAPPMMARLFSFSILSSEYHMERINRPTMIGCKWRGISVRYFG